jgi:hypothetical protein
MAFKGTLPAWLIQAHQEDMAAQAAALEKEQRRQDANRRSSSASVRNELWSLFGTTSEKFDFVYEPSGERENWRNDSVVPKIYEPDSGIYCTMVWLGARDTIRFTWPETGDEIETSAGRSLGGGEVKTLTQSVATAYVRAYEALMNAEVLCHVCGELSAKCSDGRCNECFRNGDE